MIRHIVLIFAVSLCCVKNVHCQEELDFGESNDAPHQIKSKLLTPSFIQEDHLIPTTNEFPSTKSGNGEIQKINRLRRHAGHDHGHDDKSALNISPITAEYIKKIFLNYGEKGREMNLEDFETMMKKLNFNKLKYNNGSTIAITTEHNGECASINQLFEHLYPEVKQSLQKEYEELVRENPILAKNYEVAEPSYKLTKNNINSMCPILLYQLLSDNSNENEGCIQMKYLKIKHPNVFEPTVVAVVPKKNTVLIWVYSTIAVVLCGILGLVGIAIIPFMNTKFYGKIISFLVALAVGTMTGDALLHLIPHSVVCATEEQMVQKGLACLFGIIGFYAVENAFALISEYRRKGRKQTESIEDCNYEQVDSNNKSDDVALEEQGHESHGHTHFHGPAPTTIKAVAWMIILGDGLHNFTDGMAIGAAFSESIPGGFSTSLAVFCHELPHELGDFAILIKAGMTPKAAIAYNCLTAILAFFGMIFGIVFGENDDASRWMFSVAAGLFIYIALVDMMPEMTSVKNTIQQIISQLLGLIIGIMSMLLIALYEHDLMNIFGGHNHSHDCPVNAHGHSHHHGHSH